MTEEEAKGKWCPFARVGGGPEVWNHVNRGVLSDGSPGLIRAATCVGSACMAWEWSEAKRSLAFLEAVQAHMKASAKPNFNKSVSEVWTESGGQFERVEGDCGLKRRAQ